MSLSDKYCVSFEHKSLDELQAFGALEIGNALNECIVALMRLADLARVTRGEVLEATIKGDKNAVLELKNRMKDISEYQRVIRDSKSIFQSIARAIP